MMPESEQSNRAPTFDELENLFVNNDSLDRIETYINRFNPISVMRMERMEIRHSAILAWLLDPKESHGFGDNFLKAFLGEALRERSSLGVPNAIDVSQCDFRDAEIRREWQNIDILIVSQANGWAFIIENKFDSNQGEGQLSEYVKKIGRIFKSQKNKLRVRGIFLTLWSEEPNDQSYAPITYASICEILPKLVERRSGVLSPEIKIFLAHYIEILKEATGVSEEHNEMEILARQLYRDHRKALDFVIEHGVSTDFSIAARNLFGENPAHLSEINIGKSKYVFGHLWNKGVSFLPASWFNAFNGSKASWPGCENWWSGYPLIAWLQMDSGNDGVKGKLRLFAEVGPISIYRFRRDLIERIEREAGRKKTQNIKFQSAAKVEGKKYSKFFKSNSVNISDVHDTDDIQHRMEKLLRDFQTEFEIVANVLPEFANYGVDQSP